MLPQKNGVVIIWSQQVLAVLMNRTGDKQSLVWFLVCIVSLLSSQLLMMQGETFPETNTWRWIGLLLSGIAAAALFIGRNQEAAIVSDEPPVALDRGSVSLAALGIAGLPTAERSWRPVAILVSLGLTLAILWRIPRIDYGSSHLGVFVGWLVAILLFLAAVSEPAGSRNWRSWLRRHLIEIAALSLVLLLGLLLRIWHLGILPYTLAGDEASQGLEAVRVLAGELRNPFSTGWLGVPTMSFFYNSLSIKFLGRTVFALRLPWVLIGTATIFTTYLLVRQLFNWQLALTSAAILATYHYHIHFSRLGSNQIADPFFLSLALFFLYRGLDRQRQLPWALAGITAGMAFYFYAGARLTPLIIVGVLAYLFLLDQRQFWEKHARGIATLTVSFLITAAPMVQYAVRYPGDFNARINQVGIIQSGWLENEVMVRGQPAALILLDQLQRAGLAFNLFADRTTWYGLREPLLDPVFGVIFLVGLLYGSLRLFSRGEGPRVVPMVTWWWAGMLLGGVLTESPPSSQRLITLSVPVCFFIAYALWEIVQLAVQAFSRVPVVAIMSVAVAVFAFISLNTYFFEYTPQNIYGGPDAELATEIAPMLNALKEDNEFYFVGPPFMYWTFSTIPYLVPGAVGQDVMDGLEESLLPNFAERDGGAVFIVVPERRAEIQTLQQNFPQGEIQEIKSRADDRLLGSLYYVQGNR